MLNDDDVLSEGFKPLKVVSILAKSVTTDLVELVVLFVRVEAKLLQLEDHLQTDLL